MNKNTVTKVNEYVANLGVAYIKLHNLHWNIVGPQFKSVHEYLESLYDSVTETMDETAELLRMHDELPVASLSEFLKLTTIEEIESKEINITEAIKILLSDLELLKKQAVELREVADKEDLFDLVSLLEDQISDYSKQIWFVRSMTK